MDIFPRNQQVSRLQLSTWRTYRKSQLHKDDFCWKLIQFQCFYLPVGLVLLLFFSESILCESPCCILLICQLIQIGPKCLTVRRLHTGPTLEESKANSGDGFFISNKDFDRDYLLHNSTLCHLWPLFCAAQFLQQCIFKIAPGKMLQIVECISPDVKSHGSQRKCQIACALQFLGSHRLVLTG